ncbi:MAG: DegT/DnrJ/EryC1/StrS family aminotransferase [Candidatus Omnitrophica bacterium]|nr:DegT/DnrJ/EryC1/StrS family aminotransferase [Candidatus Omnitrophota bacterium]MDD5429437.1 DegT/DnrJ/EryC1/StrS family aminotransferase [Candidatus Omnitrophota bacterium]
MIQVFSNSLGKDELAALAPVFESKWIGLGKASKLFEEELGKKLGSKRVLLTDSCTSALFLAVRILGIGPGDEVIIPSVNFIGTANAVISSGAKPVFVDVDTRYFNILPEEIERARTKKTKAVLLLHYGGHPCDMEKIYTAAKGLYIIEDNANSPFSKYKEKSCGTLGNVGCFSFDAMKILCTGNGGALCLGSDELYDKAVGLRYFGLKKKKQSGIDSFKENQKRWWEIELDSASGRFVTCDIISAIGRIQLKKVDEFIKRRKEIWNIYQKELNGLPWLITPPEPLANTESSYYFYWLKVPGGKRDAFARYLVENGVYCTFRYFPLHLIRYYGSKETLKNSELINEEAIDIPLHQNLTGRDVEIIISAVKKFI